MNCFCENNCFSFTNVSRDLKVHICYRTTTICDISRGKYAIEPSKKLPCDFFHQIDKEGNVITKAPNISKKINSKKQILKDVVKIEKQRLRRYNKAPNILDINLNSVEEQILLDLLYSEGYHMPNSLPEQSINNIMVIYMLCAHKKYIYVENKKIVKIKQQPEKIIPVSLYEVPDQFDNSDSEEEEPDNDESILEEVDMEIEDEGDSEESDDDGDTIYEL
tara:strand:- start:5 stop:664 length:660 start_codon:yes stop_codon:yes gene_type:complete